MTKNKKPRKPYRPRRIACNTLDIALHHAAKPTPEDLQDVLQPIAQCIKALREGVATEGQWAIAAGAVQMAMAIERQGIVRGLAEDLADAERALQSIYRRATATGEWKSTALYHQEINDLHTFLNLHTFQLRQLGRREFLRAVDGAERQVRRDGHVPSRSKLLANAEVNGGRLAARPSAEGAV
jgi:hypothetical protein